MDALKEVGDNLVEAWGRPDPSEHELQDMYRLSLAMLSSGYLGYVQMDPKRPSWAPLWNIAYNQGGPVPDFVYMTSELVPGGSYRLAGYRGTSRFVDISQQRSHYLTTVLGKQKYTELPAFNLDDLILADDGYFSVILSPTRPDGYDGDWWPLDPDTVRLLMRKCSCDWNNEIDARVTIDRIDDDDEPYEPISAEESARRFGELSAWIEGTIGFDMELVKHYRVNHPTNGIERSKVVGAGTGVGLQDQAYYDGIYEISDDEALIVETELPREARYWQILVADDRFCTVDWMNRQSSLNDAQAVVDADGRFRAVISAKDPGVPNWLDKADNVWGVIQLRWNRATDFPDPVVAKVPLTEVRTHLPAETAVVTPETRRQQLRHRREGAQLRQLW
jgi:hypothetical protein